MKKLLIILCFLPLFSYGQEKTDTCFTEEQVIEISMTLDSLWEADSINNVLIEQQENVINLITNFYN